MDIVGHQFTWERGRDTNEWMEVRLDRALVNLEWLNLFPMAKLYNLEGTSSDHSPILLVPQVITQFKAQFRFKFENAWMMEPMCEILVQDGWYSDSGASIFQKLKCCSKKLAIWGREVTGNFSGRIKSCKVAMQQYRGAWQVVAVAVINSTSQDDKATHLCFWDIEMVNFQFVLSSQI
ncbi:uncharacterized protein LOC141674332 [Apium graveolens]|uniref:uncharacterized protein LOC141674332 n=1 Tax=Apium graveolens TaxID=4045 RepID=UPI003D7B45D9